jgi:hypothetical protein
LFRWELRKLGPNGKASHGGGGHRELLNAVGQKWSRLAQNLRQLGDIHRNPSRLIARDFSVEGFCTLRYFILITRTSGGHDESIPDYRDGRWVRFVRQRRDLGSNLRSKMRAVLRTPTA